VKSVFTSLTANEDATYRAFLIRVKGPEKATAKIERSAKTVVTLTGLAHAYFRPGLRFTSKKPLPVGYYRISIVLRASTNPLRSATLTSKSFTIGKPSALKPKPKKKPAPKKK
jgi:hypothetical protein